ncbi:MAG: plasmid pRiA4b ORF-3 family protein [Bacteroidota bacterium]|nr:plasmid pRiA4b ORF-3 family protein [Bacteroidota bacterium]
MVFQFKIQLSGIINPTVWRRVSVPAQFTFKRMHKLIQVAFGWEDMHLFQFSPVGRAASPIIDIPYEDDMFFDEREKWDAAKSKLRDLFTEEGQRFGYVYDMGDYWLHEIILEKITASKATKAALLAGKGACPPEDCGGPGGYDELKIILSDPDHPDNLEMREWLALDEEEDWDPAYYDLAETAKRVLIV